MFSSLRRTNFVMNVQRNFSSFLPFLAPAQLPSRMETHLWYVVPDEVKSVSLLNQYQELLSPEEKNNVLKMKGDELQKRALLARVLVRTTVARYQTNYPFDSKILKFKKNIYGKPEVDWQDDNDTNCGRPPLRFNLSHTNSLIACGVTVNVPIGVDVEEKQRRFKNDLLAFSKRYFTAEEVSSLNAIPDPETLRLEVIKLWTLKEAYVKALGRGFSAVPFNTFTIRSKGSTKKGLDLSEASEITVESSNDPKDLDHDWRFAFLDLTGSHYVAVCVGKDRTGGGECDDAPLRVIARKTIPFMEDEVVSQLTAVNLL